MMIGTNIRYVYTAYIIDSRSPYITHKHHCICVSHLVLLGKFDLVWSWRMLSGEICKKMERCKKMEF